MIDTLEKIRPKTDVRKGVYDADYEALEPLLPLAADFGIAVVIVHHTRKTPGANLLEEVSGSYGLSGWIDGVLVMRRERGSRDAALHVTGRDVEEEAELALRWDAALVRWTLLGDAEEHRRSEERKRIIAKLGEVGEPMSATDIAVEIEKKVDGVRKLVRKMVRDGELAKVAPAPPPATPSPRSSWRTTKVKRRTHGDAADGSPTGTGSPRGPSSPIGPRDGEAGSCGRACGTMPPVGWS